MNNISAETLRQLGGEGRLGAMIGAHSFLYNSSGLLQFQFKGCKHTNLVQITLNGSDLYDVKFIKFMPRKGEMKTVKEAADVFAADLKELIENHTGLYLSL